MTDVIGATAEFSRLGYSLDESSILGDAAVKYLNVSEYTNIEDAAQSIVSTMQAFGIAAEDVGSIVDKFNEIGNNYAISSEGLGEAMQRSAASLALAGNTLDESLALVTAANEVVQDPDVVGTWAKTLTMYLRAAKTEAEEAGVETEGMANSVSELRDSVLQLTGNRVDIMQDDSTFKSTVQIMREIANVYDSMTDLDQAALLELLSGKRQANTTAALISNWETVEKAIVSSENAFGSADKENETYMNSIEGRLAQFKAQFEATSVSVLNSDLVKGVVDTGSGFLGAIQWLTENLGTIPGLIAPIVSMIASINNIGLFRTQMNADGSSSIVTAFSDIINKSKTFKEQLVKDQDILQNYFSSGVKLTGNDLLKQMDGASNSAIDFAESVNVAGMSADEAKTKINSFVQSQQAGTRISTQFANALKGIGSALAGMAVMTAITFAISKVIDIVDDLTMSASEAAEVTENVTQQFSSTSSSLQESISDVEALRERFDELSQGVSDNGRNISLATSEYEEYYNIVSQLSSLNPGLIRGYNEENQAIVNKNSAIQDTIDLLKQQRVEEAKNTVYGGRNDNDGNKTNLEATFIDFENQYNDYLRGMDSIKSEIANSLINIFIEAEKSGFGDQMQAILEETAGASIDSLTGSYKNKGMSGFITQYQDELSASLPSLIAQFSELGFISNETAQEVQGLSDEFMTQRASMDATASSMKTMIQALYESNESYFDLSEQEQGFLELFRTNIPADELFGMSAADLSSMVNKLISGVSNNPQVKSQVEGLYSLLANKDSMPVKEFLSAGQELANSIAYGIGVTDIDFAALFGFDDFVADVNDIKNTVIENFQGVFDGVTLEGTTVNDLIEEIDFDNLSLDQLSAMNNLLATSGDRAAEFAGRMAALASVGQLGNALDQVSNALEEQAGSFHTVSKAISDYEAAVDGLVDGADTHESMVEIYDEFAASVNKGQINTETAREQMELLIGDIVSLEEAKQWVADNEGLFLTGTDEDLVGQDLTGILNTLESKYNQFSDAEKSVADNLMNVDWDTGSIQVAQADVEKLADLFDISAASLQQALDLISTYSDYVEPSTDSMVSNMGTVGKAAETLRTKVSEAERDTTVAWDKMTVEQKMALQSLTDGLDIDISSMTVSQILELADAYDTLRSKFGETVSAESITSFFSEIKTAAGDAAATVQSFDDGSFAIDITDLAAVADALGTTEEKATIALNAISLLRENSEQPITLTINGQSVQTQASTITDQADDIFSKLEKEYEIRVDANQAKNEIQLVSDSLSTLKDKTITIKTVRVTQSASNGYTSTNILRGDDYTGVTGNMTAMAGGGKSKGGKTLVGELGRELWISRDGKRQKLVGENGMEVITMRAGDAIVPNDMTEALIRGGMRQAAGGVWEGTNSSGALSNLNYATGGNHTNWTSAAKSVASAAKSAASASEALEDQLDELKEAFDKTLNTFEHSIYLLEEKNGPVQEMVAIYKEA